MVEHTREVDRVMKWIIEEKMENESLTLSDPSDEEIQGLKYRKGDHVIDTVTGKEVTILAGKRTSYTV
jgi:hypothetical protein